ncbi:phosphoribosylaminoimidazolesuccinocarboxamide synthase [Arcticibacter eurypsychrophilus]|uniref:phosphoribosylaminoimidazolesuccinocarboxamide synthase n=1 Tax=Arcticibacter eurypsychrophilus TaxID=1434752 RepID=UPI00084DEBE8|nr:phosphoribosylaminoimidazolesuccinocarboxamide synthase [Arcticibacter eurypsychrophilus]
MTVINETHFNFPGQTKFYKGKVRDVYTIGDHYIVMIVSDRVSAFDVILPDAIPYKGQVLNQIAAKSLKATEDILPNWLIDIPDPNVTIGKICDPFKVEMVIRGYLAGHALREYQDGKRFVCGVSLPEGLKENDRLAAPIITPTTKASIGHDEDISREDIITRGIVAEDDYLQIEQFTRRLFQRGTDIAAERGLILVDTKYEFGKAIDGKIYLIDEIHTPDSSRYFYKDTYQQLQDETKPQRQLSKEFLRQWLIENGFQGKEGQKVPFMSAEVIQSISDRYVELYEQITGDKFRKGSTDQINERIEANVIESLKRLS